MSDKNRENDGPGTEQPDMPSPPLLPNVLYTGEGQRVPIDHNRQTMPPSNLSHQRESTGNLRQAFAPHRSMNINDRKADHPHYSFLPNQPASFNPSSSMVRPARPWDHLQSRHSANMAPPAATQLSYDPQAFVAPSQPFPGANPSFGFWDQPIDPMLSQGFLPIIATQGVEAPDVTSTSVDSGHTRRRQGTRARGEARRGLPRPRNWTADEERTLMRMYAESRTIENGDSEPKIPKGTNKRVAAALGKTPGAVEAKYWRLQGGDPKAYRNKCGRRGGPRGGRGGSGGRDGNGNGGSGSGLAA